MRIPTTIRLPLQGLGIVLYSPDSVAQIEEGQDFLALRYTDPALVAEYVRNGTIVGFCTGSPGTYLLDFRVGYPDANTVARSRYTLRLVIKTDHGVICVRDLYDLMQWKTFCPEAQQIHVVDGVYHITLCSNPPPSGVIGDNQRILVYLKEIGELPRLSYTGVPTLCD